MTIVTASLRLLDRISGALGVLDRPIPADSLIAIARRHTGLSHFGEIPFTAPLGRLLDACTSESALSFVGRSATKWDVVRFLTNLLLIQEYRTRNQGMDNTPIRAPVFITGLPRSGTTFLHRLMLLDPASRAPSVWETIYPSPTAGTRTQRVARVAGQLKTFELLAPEFPALHPLEATSPQECSEITAHVFRSLRFDTNYHIPSYRDWMDGNAAENIPAYRFHKRFLQYLQHQDGVPRRWVLKCPEHLFALDAIRSVYPDARLVFVHRDPVRVLLSQARLTEVLRRPFTRNLNPVSLGADESRRWLEGARRMMALADDPNVCHVHHLDLISDPVRTVETIYQRLGGVPQAQVVTAIEQYIASRPRGGYGEHHYTFADHGLDEAAEREKFRPYMTRFGIVPEGDSGRVGSTVREQVHGE